jgi:cell wall-associated NlpC family hydrolase
MKAILISASLLLSLPLLGENPYEDEITAIRLRSADLINHGRIRIDQMGSFKNAWTAIGSYAKELSEIALISKNHRDDSIDPDLQALHSLTFEKVFIDALKQRLDVILPKTEEYLQIAEEIVAQYPDLRQFQTPYKDEVLAELHQLNKIVTLRKDQVEENLQIWREWQMGVALQAELDHQGVIADRLSVFQDIGQVRGLLHRLWLNALQSLYARDFKKSRQVLRGYNWFKSAIPLYFSDKISTKDQADFFKEVLKEAEEKEKEMAAQYSLLTTPSSWRILAEEGSGGFEGSEREGGDFEGNEHEDTSAESDRDGFSTKSKEVIDFANNLHPGSDGVYRIERMNGESYAVAEFKVHKDVCKYDEAGNGTAKFTAEGKGFIKYGQDRNPVDKVDLPAGPELQHAIDRGTTVGPFNYEGSSPCDPKIEKENKEYRDKWDHLDKMVSDAKSQAKNEEDKKGLENVQNALNEFQNFQSQFDLAIQNKVKWIRHAQNTAVETIRGLTKSLPSAPSPKIPSPVDRQRILEQLETIRQSIWNTALSTGRSISHALGDFIQNQVEKAPPQLQGAIKEVTDAAQQHSTPPKPIASPKYTPMTSGIRSSILKGAKALRDGSKIIKYSQINRLGPDSYDCSGFVTSMYAAAGMPIGFPNVEGIIALANSNGPFREVTLQEAEPGDLVIWKKSEGKNTYNHVAIFDGEQTVNGETGPAVISTSSSASKAGNNTIQEILIKYMMGDRKHPVFHIFQWKKK